ncbi:natural product precursor [Chitinophaga skermanii]|uniref:Natural product n=1 Tax=Chitinophaga skermanii TaxID=331697 RepID=A0A327QYG7_9BACT|nr:class I lanthipeptide [Chitinophaga skermanii]RAJ08764.1 natural product precursor [Chitinophaga skermanii]
MKKKKLQLAKLTFDKNVVAVLNEQEMTALLGGAATNNTLCATQPVTCQTIPYTQMNCRKCID